MATLVEQRKNARTQLSWPVSVWLPQAGRFFNGTSANVSKSGVLIHLPVTTPVRCGNVVELNFPRTARLAREKGCYARIKAGKVVRVDRTSLLKNGHLAVAVQFQQ